MADHASRDDLKIYLERLTRGGLPEIRLVTRGATLAVFGCTQAPEGLLDPIPVVLVLRSFSLAQAPPTPVDLVVPARSLLDRIARQGLLGLTLDLPEVSTTAAWAGVLPPSGGWDREGAIDATSLANVAREGAERVASALPDSPGEPLLRKVRGEVWGAEIAPGVPAAAAFAADTMGFLADRAPVRVSSAQTWRRLATSHGDVLIRTPFQ